jgi:hypothetical protein
MQCASDNARGAMEAHGEQPNTVSGDRKMMDFGMILGTVLFFVISIGYTLGCERLR